MSACNSVKDLLLCVFLNLYDVLRMHSRGSHHHSWPSPLAWKGLPGGCWWCLHLSEKRWAALVSGLAPLRPWCLLYYYCFVVKVGHKAGISPKEVVLVWGWDEYLVNAAQPVVRSPPPRRRIHYPGGHGKTGRGAEWSGLRGSPRSLLEARSQNRTCVQHVAQHRCHQASGSHCGELCVSYADHWLGFKGELGGSYVPGGDEHGVMVGKKNPVVGD